MNVSIIVTAYNYEHYIDECLDSCLSQINTSLEYEVIVVDDGSTDHTQSLLANRKDDRLTVVRIQNSGIERASNTGFELARGDYIVRVDADDVLSSNYLGKMELELHKGLDFYYSNYTIINDEGLQQEVVKLPAFDPKEIMKRGDFLATGTLFLSKVLKKNGGYSTKKRNSGLENYELIIKMINEGRRGLHVSLPLFFYRRHRENMSQLRLKSIIDYGCNLFERNGLGEFSTNQYHPYKLIYPPKK
jgi:glycosyltransferase involved in cell wall biosynthesis